MADDDEGPAIRLVPSRDPNTPRASDGLAGNPFGAPADNPFAPPKEPPQSNPFAKPPASDGGGNPFRSQPASQPSESNPFNTQQGANPFGSPTDASAAPASNPFVTTPSSEGGSPFGAQPTSNPFGAPPSSGEAALDLDRPTTDPAASKPELDEWNRSMTTGEFNLQGETLGGDRSRAITGEMQRPTDAQLQSAPPTAGAPPAAVDGAGGSGNGRLIAIALGVLVFLVAAALGGKIVYSKMTKKPPRVVESSSTETDAFVRRMQADAENAPDCWNTDDGYGFVYKDEAGELVKVDAIAEVPVLYRKNAVCVPD